MASIDHLIEKCRDVSTPEEEIRKGIYQYAANIWAQEGQKMFQSYVKTRQKQAAHTNQASSFAQQNMMKSPAYSQMVNHAAGMAGAPLGPPPMSGGPMGPVPGQMGRGVGSSMDPAYAAQFESFPPPMAGSYSGAAPSSMVMNPRGNPELGGGFGQPVGVPPTDASHMPSFSEVMNPGVGANPGMGSMGPTGTGGGRPRPPVGTVGQPPPAHVRGISQSMFGQAPPGSKMARGGGMSQMMGGPGSPGQPLPPGAPQGNSGMGMPPGGAGGGGIQTYGGDSFGASINGGSDTTDEQGIPVY